MQQDKESTPRLIGQRDGFLEALFQIFKQDRNCIFITADNGAPSLDQFSRELGSQFVQVGIAEQQMMGMASGLAVEGKRPFVYAILPFVSSRVHEFVKLDICAANLPITILGVGAGAAYDNMGPSHHSWDDIALMRPLPNLEIYSPADSVCAAALARICYDRNKPTYIRFDRSGLPDLYNTHHKFEFEHGFMYAGKWEIGDTDVRIYSTGVMVHRALEVMELLGEQGVNCEVIDVFRLKPLPDMPTDKPTVSIEEHFLAGGLGSILAELWIDNGIKTPLLRLGRTDAQSFCLNYGGREAIHKEMGLDAESVANRITEWLKNF